ncbi:MAG: hypothetical protein Q4B54_04145 [Coriobacteriales bacterium]|nr:hypothetical protein [Coriobacteriales bacterium]
MAIIRNDRTARQEPGQGEIAELEEEEIDYSWHPTEEEFSSPITAEQWAELLGDTSFCETDAARSVRCLYEYGEPATFQQLSIRYRGTMGRYRRWLSEAAQAAGERYGVGAPQKDRFGMDEWWPLLYRTRTTGKPGAGIYEMELRPEVESAYALIEQQEREAKLAENARNLKRIEQLERARQEERARKAAQQAEREAREAEAARIAEEARAAEAALAQEMARRSDDARPVEVAQQQLVLAAGGAIEITPNPPVVAAPEQPSAEAPASSNEDNAPAASERADKSAVALPTVAAVVPAAPAPEPEPEQPTLGELTAFLLAVKEAQGTGAGARFLSGGSDSLELAPLDVAAPVDYALRYAERLRAVLALMCEGSLGVSGAALARELGDESVEAFQNVLNGQCIPSFDYLDKLRTRLFINVQRLEVIEGREGELPSFSTLDEIFTARELVSFLAQDTPQEIAYVVDDSKDRRTGVIVRFSPVRCALLTRTPTNSKNKRSKTPLLKAFVAMVDELDAFARERGISRTSQQLSEEQWDALAAGTVWPGTYLP